jgi:DNA invertase Pin-like site-specific DNA recombinase
MQTDGHSLDAQLACCRRLCQERGWSIAAEYQDIESARTAARPCFQQMLADAEQHAFDVIVVHKLDRFSRSVTDTLFTLRRLSANNVSVLSITENMDYTTPIGKVMLTMLASFAEWYIDNLSQETKKGHKARVLKGGWNGRLPFGYSAVYRKDGGDGVPHPDETATGVRLAFQSYSEGCLSDRAVARVLNDAGYRPRGQGSRALPLWSKDSVAYLLQNRFYVGEVLYRGEWHKGQQEPIIDEPLFEQCQQVRHRRACVRNGTTQNHRARVYPLAGIARCARCGSYLRGYSCYRGHTYRYYRDPARDRGGDCRQKPIRASEAEDALGEFLSGIQLPGDWRGQVLGMIREQALSDDAAQDRNRLEQRLDRLRQLFLMGDLPEASYKSERDALKAQIATLHPPQMPDIEAAGALLADFRQIWQLATDTERRDLIRSLLEAVYLDKEQGPVVAIEPRPALALLLPAGTTGFPSAGNILIIAPGTIFRLP